MSEAALIREILLAASERGARLFRVNTGMGWTGTVRHVGSEVRITNPRPIHAGLTEGGADIVGWSPDGLFVAIECKVGKTITTSAQMKFLEAVKRARGRAGIARSVEDAVKIMEGRG